MVDARDRLSVTEGGEVSWREIVRRAGFDDSDFGRVSYHLRPRTRSRGQHHVPPWLIDALEPVLPVTREEMNRAAAHAAGYRVDPDALPGSVYPSLESVLPNLLDALNDDRVPLADRERAGLQMITAISNVLRAFRQEHAG